MKTVYQANDGTLFNFQSECEDYETATFLSKSINDGYLKMLLADNKIVNDVFLLEDPSDALSTLQCDLIAYVCYDPETALEVNQIFNNRSVSYNEIFVKNDFDYWVRLENEISACEKKLNNLKKLKKIINF